MRNIFKKFLSYLFVFTIVITIFNFNLVNVHAEGEHQFIIKAYDWDPTTNDWEGSGTGKEFLDNDAVEPGQIIKVDIYYIPGANTEISMQIAVNYDPTIVEPLYADGDLYVETDMSTTYQGGIWPAAGTTPSGKKKTNWVVTYNDYTNNGNQIRVIAEDNLNDKALETEGVIASFYLKVKDTVPSGTSLNIAYDDSYTMVYKSWPKTTQGLNLNVKSEVSTVTTLNTLTVKNGDTTYTLNPTFNPDTSSTKEYTAIIPNQITSVDVLATPTSDNATVISGIGTNEISVGNNDINVIVQAEDGTQDAYIVHVYRLNNDATLKSLSLTNSIDIGEFNSSKTLYTALVPYSTKNTTITATQNDVNATITSGTGNWELVNYGSMSNTKTITVQAENCKSNYSSVPNNSCTEKEYSIDITRTAPSSNANLSYLTVDGVSVPEFSESKYEYTLDNVSNNTTKVNINALVADTGKASIITTLGEKTLSVGDNKLVITVRAEDGSTQDYIINVRRLSNDSTLSNLTVTSTPIGELNPTFNSTIYEYTYTAPSTVESVTIASVANDTENAKILSGNGTYNVNTTSSVNIIVQAEDKTTSTYVVNIERTKSSNANLKSLSIDGYNLNETFSPDITSYTANVSGEVSNINVSAVVEDTGKATVTGTGNHDLAIGNNLINVIVKAENGTTKTYKIIVTRAKKTLSSLSDLRVDGVTVTGFTETKLEYNLGKVSFDKKTINVEATAKDPDSTITGTGEISLKTGDNKIYVTVLAQDEVTKTSYVLNIEREKDSNNYLSDIKIDGVTITDFEKSKLTYETQVLNNVTSLNLTVLTESETASYIITGNEDFKTTKINEIKVLVTAEDGSIRTYTINVTKAKSDNNYLKSISLSNGALSPSFNKLTNDYMVNVSREVTTETITASVEDETASYEVSGPTTLEIGENTFKITVTSESGIENVYTIIVTRNKSNNNYLSDLKIDSVTVPKFNKNTDLYEINVDSSKESINISATTEEVHATTKGTGEFNLITGQNEFLIVVTAEDGTEKTYKIIVTRAKSDNSKLSSLSIKQTIISPEFSPSILSYVANVEYSVTNVDIVAIASDSRSTVTGAGNKDLKTGENVFEIVVTSEDETTTTYILTINRAKNDNANLSNITLSGGYSLVPSFSSNTTEYNVTVPNETDSIDIDATKQDSNAVSIVGIGNKKLSTGENIINIVVTAEDGITNKTYKVTITREKSSDATLKSLSVDNGTLNPSFNKDITKYKLTVPNEIKNINVSTELSNESASFIIAGNENLTVGKNNCTITVTAEDGTIKVYTIEIERQPSSNNFLKSLSVKDANSIEYIKDFSKTKLSYDIEVENEINEVTIIGELEDSTSSIVGIGVKNLDIGNNSFEVKVTSAANIERIYTLNIFRKANSNNYLKTLSVENFEITPKFDKNTTNYTLNVDSLVTKINILAESEVDTSIVSGTGEVSLTTGENTFSVTVQAEDGSIKSYVIIVTKAASNNNYLSNISIDKGTLTPEFNKDVLNYSVHVENSVKTLNINAITEDASARVEGTGLKSLSVGTHKVELIVTAENNEVRKYIINITRDASANNDLIDLKVNDELIKNFNKDVLEYELNYDNSVDSIIISVTAADETADITGIGSVNLSTGENEILITVTAENGNVKIYKLKVIRAKSDNNYLSNLSVAEGSLNPEFNKETLEYSVIVPFEVNSLTIDKKTEDSNAQVSIEGNNNFVVGENEVVINVTAENENVRIYKIKVTKQPEANNFLTDIQIKDNNDVTYTLSPSFNKNIYNYTVEIPETVIDMNISVTKQDKELQVEGDGQVPITSLPQSQKIIVRNDSGLERTYTINFVKGLSSNTYLESLSVSNGILTPSFNKNTSDYTVKLPAGTNSIDISAVKSEDSQIVTGLGTKKLSTGNNTFKITVTSENGNIRTYTIIVKVEAYNENNKLLSLSVDKGTLTPAFDKDIRMYTVDLDESEEDITISATGSNTVTGTGKHSLDIGSNVFEIISTDSSNIENVYRIVVNRGVVTSTYLKYLAVDNYRLNEEFNKENSNYTLNINSLVNKLDVIAIAEDKNATVSITGNENLNLGINNITITVTDEQSNTKTYTIAVNIGKNKIESSIHTIDENYISTIAEKKTAGTIKEEMTNPKEQLKIYNSSDVEVSDDTIVGSGYKIKLVINNTIYDSKILIIKGDVNGDGEIGVADIIKLRLHILETSQLDSNGLLAADVNNDNDIGVADILKIRNHILGNINLFEKEGE